MWGMAAELAIIAAIWFKYRERAGPFVIAAVFIVAQMLTMGLLSDSALLRSMLLFLGQQPSAAIVGTGFLIGTLTSFAGWYAGVRAPTPAAPLPQAA
jgi:hypothetical protein